MFENTSYQSDKTSRLGEPAGRAVFIVILLVGILSGCGWFRRSIGIDDMIRTIDEAIRAIEYESADWKSVLNDTRQKLIEGGQETIANQIEQLTGHAIQGVGIETRCTIGFARDLVIEGLKRIKARLLNQTPVLIPQVCQPVPPTVNLDAVKKGDLSQITLDGYNLDQNMHLILVNEQGARTDVTQHFLGGEYLRTINISSNGIRFADDSDKLVIELDNRTIYAIDIIKPYTPPPPPKIVLTDAAVNFFTTNDNKDGDTKVHVYLICGGNTVATVSDTWGEFDDNSESGWKYLSVIEYPPKDTVIGNCRVELVEEPNGHDEWHFNWRLELRFSDSTTKRFDFSGGDVDYDRTTRSWSLK